MTTLKAEQADWEAIQAENLRLDRQRICILNAERAAREAAHWLTMAAHQ